MALPRHHGAERTASCPPKHSPVVKLDLHKFHLIPTIEGGQKSQDVKPCGHSFLKKAKYRYLASPWKIPGKQNDPTGQRLNRQNTEWDIVYGQSDYCKMEWIRS